MQHYIYFHFLIIDSRVVIQTLLLSHYIPPKGRIRVHNNKHLKFSISECKDSMIMHITVSIFTTIAFHHNFSLTSTSYLDLA